jgi:chemotaxis protein MotB
MARRKKSGEEEGQAPWLITYADLMSLLLTFFVLLLSFSTLEERKVKEALSSLKGALGVLPRSIQPMARPEPKPPTIQKPTREEQVKTKVGKFRRQLRSKGLERQIQAGQRDRGILNITLPASVLFRSGSAQLLESAYEVLRQDVAELLRFHMEEYDSGIRIEGHTDDVPIVPGSQVAERFPTNWELSTARALSVMRFLTEQANLSEDAFSVAGYGPNKPLRRPANLEENRRLNRRVEIIAIPKKHVPEAPEDRSVGPDVKDQQLIPRDDLPEPL